MQPHPLFRFVFRRSVIIGAACFGLSACEGPIKAGKVDPWSRDDDTAATLNDDMDAPGEPDGIDLEDTGTSYPDDYGLKDAGVTELPAFHLSPERPISGDPVSLSIDKEDGSEVEVEVSGTGCGTFTNTWGRLPFELTGMAAANGYCQFDAAITMKDGTVQSYSRSYEVRSTNPVVLPIQVPGGVLQFGAVPESANTPDRPTIADVTGAEAFTNGTTTTLTVNTHAEDVQALLIGIKGYDGHYLLPVQDDAETIAFPVYFRHDQPESFALPTDTGIAPPSTSSDLDTMTVRVAVVTGPDVVSSFYEKELDAALVGTGDVNVSVTWDTHTDVDLHVYEPDGEHIYYGATVSSTGGMLDLDSNPGCSIDGVNSEHIYWPEGTSPSGTYEVEVHMFNDCGVGEANGTLTVNHCGSDSPMVKSFSLAGTDDVESWTFDSECAYTVSGVIKYEDIPIKVTGKSRSYPSISRGDAVALPSRKVTVQVVRESDDEVLAESTTDEQGRYRMPFENDGEAGYRVRVLAKHDSSTMKQKVISVAGDLYAWESEVQDETEDEQRENLNITVKTNDNSGALNIFDIGVDGIALVSTRGKRVPPMLTWMWSEGTPHPEGSVSVYQSKVIYVLSLRNDSDEFDDAVLAHEFGHFAMDVYSRDNNPGGGHSPWSQDDPRLAWSEGAATYIGSSILKTTAYVDSKRVGGAYFNVETLGSGIPLGNRRGRLSGKLSEAVVAAVMLDLHDATNETNDTISNAEMSIWQVLRTYMAPGYAKWRDRGVSGVDLVDFLDGWRCLGLGNEGANDNEGLRGNVRGLHALAYDFRELASCK